jgi:C1A family cysteine protease
VISITAEAPVPPLSVAQESAVRSAESYLSFKGFSRQGLFEQLTSEYGEGFEAADAEFALAHIEQAGGVDWNQEAVEAAQSYLEFKGFSRQGLFEQLTSEYGEAFTAEQANFALDQVGL